MKSLTTILMEGTLQQVQKVVDAGLIPLIIKALAKVGFEAFAYSLSINVIP